MIFFEYKCKKCGIIVDRRGPQKSRWKKCRACGGIQTRVFITPFSHLGASYPGTSRFDFSMGLGRKFESSKEVDRYLEETGSYPTPLYTKPPPPTRKEITEKEVHELLNPVIEV